MSVGPFDLWNSPMQNAMIDRRRAEEEMIKMQRLQTEGYSQYMQRVAQESVSPVINPARKKVLLCTVT